LIIQKNKKYFQDDLLMDNLKFSYPFRPNCTVLNINNRINKLSIQYDKKYRVFGRSGFSNSILIDLILWRYDPSRGGIYLDGDNIKEEYNLK